MSELKLRADPVISGAVTHGQVPFAPEIPYPHVLTGDPVALVVHDVPESLGGGGMLDEVFESALALVPVRIETNRDRR